MTTTETLEQIMTAENARENMKAPTKKELFMQTSVTVIATENPKKKGSMSYDRFQGYFNKGIETVEDCFKAGLRADDIRHDSEHGFILLNAEG